MIDRYIHDIFASVVACTSACCPVFFVNDIQRSLVGCHWHSTPSARS